jgi:hypothetical protein
MSLVNISHPGRPGYDELVPSRYALPSPFAARSPHTCTPGLRDDRTLAPPPIAAYWLPHMMSIRHGDGSLQGH